MSPAKNFGHHEVHNGDFQTVLTDAQGYTSTDYEAEPAVGSYLNGDVNYTLDSADSFLAKLSQSAYDYNSNRKQYITDRGQKLGDITNFNVMEKDPYSDISMVSYKNLTDDKLFIAFKGTDNLFDVFSDFNVFLDYTESMISPLDSLVTTYTPYIKGLLQNPAGYNLVLTGHSLGALIILNIISNLCQDSELTQSHLDRIDKCVCFAPYILRTQAYNYVHTACGDSNHPKQSYLKNLFEFHITDSDLASIIVRSRAGAFGNLIVYPDKTNGLVTSFLGASYASYNIYENHTLSNWSNDQYPDQVVPTLEGNKIEKTIRCIKHTLLLDHLQDNTVNQYPLLYNMGTDVADSTSDLRFAFAEQHTQYWKNYNWDLIKDPIIGGYKTVEHLATVYMAFRYELRNNHTYTEVGGLTLFVYAFNHLNISTEYNFLVEQLQNDNFVTLGYLTIPNGDLNILVGRHNDEVLKDTFAGQFHPNLVISSQTDYNERQTFEIGGALPEPVDADTVPYNDDLRRFINNVVDNILLTRYNNYASSNSGIVNSVNLNQAYEIQCITTAGESGPRKLQATPANTDDITSSVYPFAVYTTFNNATTGRTWKVIPDLTGSGDLTYDVSSVEISNYNLADKFRVASWDTVVGGNYTIQTVEGYPTAVFDFILTDEDDTYYIQDAISKRYLEIFEKPTGWGTTELDWVFWQFNTAPTLTDYHKFKIVAV